LAEKLKGVVMQKKEYELVVIFNSQLSEEAFKKLVDKYESIFLADDGEIIKKNDWGTKKLAYAIKGNFRGRYLFYDFVGYSKHIKEAERLMGFDESVLRYFLIRIDEDIDVDKRKVELAKLEALASAAKKEVSGKEGSY
jgi:small subunit ribosomal protein S6